MTTQASCLLGYKKIPPKQSLLVGEVSQLQICIPAITTRGKVSLYYIISSLDYECQQQTSHASFESIHKGNKNTRKHGLII